MIKVPGVTLTALFATLLLSLSGVDASAASYKDKNRPMTPEAAAKLDNFRKQHEQRVTQAQRDTAAQTLKEKRREVLRAKRAAKRNLNQTPQSPQ